MNPYLQRFVGHLAPRLLILGFLLAAAVVWHIGLEAHSAVFGMPFNFGLPR